MRDDERTHGERSGDQARDDQRRFVFLLSPFSLS